MKLRELLSRLSEVPDLDAEVLVQVPDPNDSEVPEVYMIEDVTFVDWPKHYAETGAPPRVRERSRPEVYIKV